MNEPQKILFRIAIVATGLLLIIVLFGASFRYEANDPGSFFLAGILVVFATALISARWIIDVAQFATGFYFILSFKALMFLYAFCAAFSVIILPIGLIGLAFQYFVVKRQHLRELAANT